MILDVAAKRYAEAAYLIAREDGTEDAWQAGLNALGELFGDEQAQAFLNHSRIPFEEKRKLVEKALAGVDPQVRNLALLLLRRARTRLGPQIAEAYQELVDLARGVHHATVTSAVPLNADDSRAIQRRLEAMTGGQIVMETRVDESILGGLVVRIGDQLIDGSTRSRLQQLKQQLAGVAR